MNPATAFRSEEQFTQRQFRRWLTEVGAADSNRYELLRGQIVMSPPAGWTHGRIEARLARLLDEHVSRHRLGMVFGASTGYELPSGDTVQPDVSYVSTERFARQPPIRQNEFLRVAPDLVIEVLSPATASHDLVEKKTIYERNGIDEYWIVDPLATTVTVFRLDAGGYAAGRKFLRGKVTSHVLPRLRLATTKLFDR